MCEDVSRGLHRRPAESDGSYRFSNASPAHTHAYVLPTVIRLLDRIEWPADSRRVFDLGCGNGATAAQLSTLGYEVVGVDPSEDGVRIANATYPHIRIHQGSAYDDLASTHGRFQALVSLEVIEHVFFPRKFAACVYSLLEQGGTAIISTPYHGYWKNLALALSGKLDAHFTALWECGHIKFWSRKTLTRLLHEVGLQVIDVIRVGRIPVFAKSMIVVAQRL